MPRHLKMSPHFLLWVKVHPHPLRLRVVTMPPHPLQLRVTMSPHPLRLQVPCHHLPRPLRLRVLHHHLLLAPTPSGCGCPTPTSPWCPPTHSSFRCPATICMCGVGVGVGVGGVEADVGPAITLMGRVSAHCYITKDPVFT